MVMDKAATNRPKKRSLFGRSKEQGAATEPGRTIPPTQKTVPPTQKTTLEFPPEAPPELEMPKRADPVLEAIRYLSRRWGRPESIDVLTAGLPLVDGLMTLKLVPRALERVGLNVTTKRTALRDLADFDMPAIVTSKRGRLLVIVERTGRNKLKCFDPATRRDVEIQTNTSEWRYRHALLLVKPQLERSTGEEETSGPGFQQNWLRSALGGHGRSIAAVLLAATFVNVFALAMPLFSLNVYDRVLPNSAVATLWVLSSGLAAVFLFDFLLKIARGAIIDYAGRTIDLRLSTILFDRVANARLDARPSSTGAFINRIAQYEVLRDFFTSQTIVMFIDILFMGLFVYVLFYLVGWIALFPVMAAAIAVVSTILIGRRSGSSVKAALAESSQRNSILVETLSSPQTVKASRAEGKFLRSWENSILSSSQTQSNIRWYQSLATQITAVVTQLASIGILIGGTYAFSQGDVTMGAIVAAMMLSGRVIAPVAQISAALLRVRSAMEAYAALNTIMKLPDERAIGKGFVSRSVNEGRIEFRKVRFAYPMADHYVLDQISFSIQPGEKVGIIGRIGSGKTTLGRLLVKFYQPSEGEILIDGVSIKQFHPSELRRQIGLVVQDPELFNGTVKENIALSNPGATDDEIVDVARRTGVDEFVARHPQGFDMPVGERGFLLSGGQRQAVALARTMLVNPRVLFLDEPSSSMDLATERQLIGNLSRALAPDHTVLIATHRFSLLKLVTRIIALDNGRIITDGERDAVLAQLKAATSGEGA